MSYFLMRSGLIVTGAVLLCGNIFISSPVLADEGISNAVASVLSLDGKPAGRKQSSSSKVLQVAQLAGDSWVVRQVTAPVRRDGAERAVAIGDRLATGDRLITGPGGQAVLVRRKDKISMSPNSDLKVGDNKGDSLFTNIVQTLGTLLFQVEKNPRQRFQVGTPYLAATVKGTTFTVSVRPEGAAVHVTDGAVQVAARGSQRAVIVRPGQTGSVSSKPGAEVEIRKREGKSTPSTGENTESAAAEQAEGKSGGEGNKASAKAPAKALASTLGTGPSNFAKLTKGFAGNANANANANANRGNSGKVNANAGGNGSARSAVSSVASAQRGKTTLSNVSSRGNAAQASNAGGNSPKSNANVGGNSAKSNANAGGNSPKSNANAGGNSPKSNANAGGNSPKSNANAGGNSPKSNANPVVKQAALPPELGGPKSNASDKGKGKGKGKNK
ncbi:MAG: FecR domain-containing protein [Alphaproteobacteria bacterium]|nr:FecR domain-containing protein [Alphaproteobacteria bacterium]